MPLRVPAAASALALVLALSGTAVHAQNQAASRGNSAGNSQQPGDPSAKRKGKDQNTEVLHEVVVTGLRQSLMSAEAIKRLAPQIVKVIFNIISEINKEGVTILLVEQNAAMALEIASYGYVLETGKVSLSDSATALRANERVRASYLGEA